MSCHGSAPHKHGFGWESPETQLGEVFCADKEPCSPQPTLHGLALSWSQHMSSGLSSALKNTWGFLTAMVAWQGHELARSMACLIWK